MLPDRCSRFAFAAALLAFALAAAGPALAANGDCSQPVSSGDDPTAPDCSYVLRASVGLVTCEMCVCDVNGTETTTTADALACLRKAVGLDIPLDCPPCEGVTTTLAQVSTTSTSTTSTTTTIPVRCDNNADCDALPDEFRCNPNTETCEKPCTRDTHCKDFYECNTSTGYCQEPALQF